MMKPASEIPRPAGSLMAHSLRFAKNAIQFYEDAYRECGDVFATRIPGLGNWVYVSSPDLARTILEAPPDVLAGGDMEGFSLSHLLGKGATSQLDGPAHQERRDVTSPHLGAQGSLRHVDGIRRITERRIAEWPLGKPFPLIVDLQKIALESLITVFFSGASPEKVRQLADLYETFSFKALRSPAASHPTFQIDLGPWSPWGRVKQRQREITEAFSQEIEARLATDPPEAGNLIATLARARLKDGSQISREAIRAEIMDMLFQGHELTGDSMTWIIGELLTHAEVLARLRQELGSMPDPPYLEAVVYEGLRRRPSNFVTSARRVKQPFPLGDYLLPEGTMVAVCYPALGMREDLFPDPKGFHPERFKGQEPPPDDRSPFGGGPHACAGRHLALMVMKTAIATIVRKAELKLAQNEIRPVRKAYYYEPNEGLRVTLEKRL